MTTPERAVPTATDGTTPEVAEALRGAVNGLTDVMVYDILSPPQAARAYAYARAHNACAREKSGT